MVQVIRVEALYRILLANWNSGHGFSYVKRCLLDNASDGFRRRRADRLFRTAVEQPVADVPA